VDTRLDQNQAELGVLVLAVALKVLADSDSLGWLEGATRQMIVKSAGEKRLTFLISMYRSSGISGARPNQSLCQSTTIQRHSFQAVSATGESIFVKSSGDATKRRKVLPKTKTVGV